MGMSADLRAEDEELEEKATQKWTEAQTFIQALEAALQGDTVENRAWLRRMVDPQESYCRTMTELIVMRKYRGYVSLRCAAMRATQLLLRVAKMFLTPGADQDHNVGISLFLAFVGRELADEAFSEIKQLARGGDEFACSAMLFLTELGPEAFALWDFQVMVDCLLDLFVALPGRADDLVEVALSMHAWGGERRAELLSATVRHPGGQLLCEVLLQVINRGVEERPLRALKVISGCLAQRDSESLLFTNDVRVLVEILLRELPAHASAAEAFACHADCYKALVRRCEAARTHRRAEMVQVLEDIRDDDRCEHKVREHCAEALRVLAHACRHARG